MWHVAGLGVAGCGYRVAGRADLLPKTIRTIHLPAWQNNTTRYRLTDLLPLAISREFTGRTRYSIVNQAPDADAILTGSIMNFQAFPIVFDPATGRATAVQVAVTLAVKLTERATGKVLFTRPGFAVSQRYEISTKPEVYFEESDAAMDRLCREVAQAVVTAILENF
jgi:hypothetical protein